MKNSLYSNNFVKYVTECILCLIFFYTVLSVICFQSFRVKFDACINPFLYPFCISLARRKNFGINDAITEQKVTILKIKFPFKRKGLPSCSASLHVKAKKYTCASDFPTLPSFFVQSLNMIKHFIVNLN